MSFHGSQSPVCSGVGRGSEDSVQVTRASVRGQHSALDQSVQGLENVAITIEDNSIPAETSHPRVAVLLFSIPFWEGISD